MSWPVISERMQADWIPILGNRGGCRFRSRLRPGNRSYRTEGLQFFGAPIMDAILQAAWSWP